MTERFARHLEPHEIASYADGDVPGEASASIDAHLADCAECRAEVADVSRIVRTAPAVRGVPRRIWAPAAAAAALAMLWMGPRASREKGTPDRRDEAVTMTASPRAIAPVGSAETARTLISSTVPQANTFAIFRPGIFLPGRVVNSERW